MLRTAAEHQCTSRLLLETLCPLRSHDNLHLLLHRPSCIPGSLPKPTRDSYAGADGEEQADAGCGVADDGCPPGPPVRRALSAGLRLPWPCQNIQACFLL